MHAAAIQEEAQALDTLNASFQEQVSMRLDGLSMSVEFYRQAQELSILLNTVAGSLRTSSARLTSVIEKFEALQMRGAELINHMKRAKRDHDVPGNSSSLRVNRVPLQSTEGCVKEVLGKIQETLEQYQERAGKQGVQMEARRGSIKDLEDVLEDIDTSVQRTLQGTASPAPPSATESLKSRETVKTNIAKRSPFKRTLAPMQFSLWDRQGSVRQLRKKFENIAGDEKPPVKSEEQKLLDRVFRDPFVTQARLKQTSSVKPVIKVNISDQEVKFEPAKHPILRGRPSIEMLRVDKNVTRLKEKFDSRQVAPVILEVPLSATSSEDAGAAPSYSNGVLTNGELGLDETDSPVKETTTVLGTSIEERSQEHSTDEADFGLWKKKKPLQKTESLNRKSFKSLRYTLVL